MPTIHFVYKRNGVIFEEEDQDAEEVPESMRYVDTPDGRVPVARIEMNGAQTPQGQLLGGITHFFSADGTILKTQTMTAAPPPPPPPETGQERDARIREAHKREREQASLERKQAINSVLGTIKEDPKIIFWILLTIVPIGACFWIFITLVLPMWWR